MRIHQTKPEFNHIFIALETADEAKRFFSIIDKLDSAYCNSNPRGIMPTKAEYELVRKLSDSRTNEEISI